VHDAIIYIDASKSVNLQNQIRQKLVDGILNGSFPPGMKLPSSRKLAAQLNVARNTVVAAYQQLVVEGYLVSRQRSGIFVSDQMLDSRVGYGGEIVPPNEKEAAAWKKRIKRRDTGGPIVVQDLPNWEQYPYPFIDGKFDASLFPLAEWREATRLALSVADVRDWSIGSGDADDPMLIEQIRSKLLTRRGIQARPDEILITTGARNGLYLVSQLLADRSVTAAIEEPGNSEMRYLLRQSGARVRAQPVDAEGLVVDDVLNDCDLVYVTPSHQIPTAVVMSPERRGALLAAASKNDLLIVEDDYECEINYLDHPQPALRSMDDTGRVIYVAGFSKVLGPGLRLGFIVANARFIDHARALRRAITNHPPLNNQRAAAFFLSLGHYDSLMSRLGRLLRERRAALHDALNWMRGVPMEISPEVGGTTYWVRTPDDFDVDKLIRAAAKRGILIEPVRHYYANEEHAENCFRMGITSIDVERIRPGVTRLVELIRSQVRDQVEQLSTSAGDWLTGDDLEAAMAGATILYREVDGAPCTIRYHPDGSMTGVLGYSNEEQDTGRWWTDGERFFRKWSRWNYGEEKGYYIVIDGDQVKFFNEEKQIVDSAFIQMADEARALMPGI
jgi:GntR family transcriptional regulator/MocR family aminotransferase